MFHCFMAFPKCFNITPISPIKFDEGFTWTTF